MASDFKQVFGKLHTRILTFFCSQLVKDQVADQVLLIIPCCRPGDQVADQVYGIYQLTKCLRQGDTSGLRQDRCNGIWGI